VPESHVHQAGTGAENPSAGQGMVVLDIGGDIGALVVIARPDLDGTEIEICPAGRRGELPDDGGSWWQGEWRHHHGPDSAGHPGGAAWPHVAVVSRPTGDARAGGAANRASSAVYPGLRAGRYELWLRPTGATALTVEVGGGQVSTVDWPASG
jgi:hypothetical protein